MQMPFHPELDLLVARQYQRDMAEQVRRARGPGVFARRRWLMAALQDWLRRRRNWRRQLVGATPARLGRAPGRAAPARLGAP